MDYLILAQAEDAAAGAFVVFILILYVACIGLSILFGVVSFALWIWMLIDCATNEPAHENEKIVWILVIALLQGIGALIYFLARRPTRIRKYGR